MFTNETLIRLINETSNTNGENNMNDKLPQPPIEIGFDNLDKENRFPMTFLLMYVEEEDFSFFKIMFDREIQFYREKGLAYMYEVHQKDNGSLMVLLSYEDLVEYKYNPLKGWEYKPSSEDKSVEITVKM